MLSGKNGRKKTKTWDHGGEAPWQKHLPPFFSRAVHPCASPPVASAPLCAAASSSSFVLPPWSLGGPDGALRHLTSPNATTRSRDIPSPSRGSCLSFVGRRTVLPCLREHGGVLVFACGLLNTIIIGPTCPGLSAVPRRSIPHTSTSSGGDNS